MSAYEECLKSFIIQVDRDQAVRLAKLNVFRTDEGILVCNLCKVEYNEGHICHYSKRPNDMSYEQNRLTTFEPWPMDKDVRPSELAEEGFYYLKRTDAVECAFCHGRLLNWKPDDVAPIEHKRHYPNCIFVRGACTTNKPRELACPQYRNPEERRKTFMHDEWAICGKDNKTTELIEAGFFYKGSKDIVQCFCCGGCLNEFTGSDDIWFDHAVFFPGCAYVRKCKGVDYIRQLHKYKTPVYEVTEVIE